MGVKLLPPRLYKSELANRESLRDTLLLVELDTARKKKKREDVKQGMEGDHFMLQASKDKCYSHSGFFFLPLSFLVLLYVQIQRKTKSRGGVRAVLD